MGQKDLKPMKTGVHWIENQGENWWKNKPNLGPSISGTKCDRDKPILFRHEEGGQSDWLEAYNRDLIGSKFSKDGGHHRGTSLPYRGVPPPLPGITIHPSFVNKLEVLLWDRSPLCLPQSRQEPVNSKEYCNTSCVSLASVRSLRLISSTPAWTILDLHYFLSTLSTLT